MIVFVKDRVRAEIVIFLQRDDVAGQVVGANLVDRFLIAEELNEAVEHGFVLAVGIWFLERFDLRQVDVHCDVQRWGFRRLASQFESANAELATF